MKELESSACCTKLTLVVVEQGLRRSDVKDLNIDVDVGGSA